MFAKHRYETSIQRFWISEDEEEEEEEDELSRLLSGVSQRLRYEVAECALLHPSNISGRRFTRVKTLWKFCFKN